MVTLYANVYVKHSVFSAQQHMLSALYAIARSFVRLSVHHTGGSVENG